MIFIFLLLFAFLFASLVCWAALYVGAQAERKMDKYWEEKYENSDSGIHNWNCNSNSNSQK